jgi:tellurite resistance protein TehA-like permease
MMALVPRAGTRLWTATLDSIPPASGAVVMGTGIVSVALLLDGRHALSMILFVIAAVVWLALAVLLPARAARDGERFAVDLRHPTALTSIAGTEVLGTRLTLAGWDWAGTGLLVIGTAIWLGLVPHVLRHWQTPTIGASFILTVATESLALLAATVAFSEHAAWLLYAALAPFCLGLGFYAFVLSRFQFRQLAIGRGDHWVTGGALAISTVAAGRIALAAQRTGTLWHGHGPAETISLVLWCLTMAWLPALVLAEILRPRLSYNVRRWSTVFPVGMYAACSFIVGALTNTRGIVDFARVWVWVGAGVWLVVFLAMLASGRRLIAGEDRLA